MPARGKQEREKGCREGTERVKLCVTEGGVVQAPTDLQEQLQLGHRHQQVDGGDGGCGGGRPRQHVLQEGGVLLAVHLRRQAGQVQAGGQQLVVHLLR